MKIEKSSGNVFTDLGFAPDQAALLLARSDLIIHIKKQIQSHGWSQQQTAELLGIKQPQVSHIINGKIEKFSLDTLFIYSKKLGLKPKLVF